MLRRLLKYIFFPLLIVVVGFYLLGTQLVQRYSQDGFDLISEYAQKRNFGSVDITFRDAHVSSWRSLIWKELRSRFQISVGRDVVFLNGKAREIELTVEDLELSSLVVTVRDFSFSPSGIKAHGHEERVKRVQQEIQQFGFVGSRFRLRVPFSFREPRRSVESILAELVKLSNGKIGKVDAELDATVNMLFDGNSTRSRLILAKRFEHSSGVAVALHPDDVQRIVQQSSDNLTKSEIELIARNPLRVAQLMDIRRQAALTSQRAHELDPTVPEDPYRHILWSYLLTKEFGADFAEEVTDAHEDVGGSSDAFDHEMDYINNRVGREWALQGIAQGDLLELVRNDPRVIRLSLE